MLASIFASVQDNRSKLITVIRRIAERGWCPATSGNFSMKLSDTPPTILITPSGADKSKLTEEQLLEATLQGDQLHCSGTPSAEALLHAVLYSELRPGAILHVHTVANTILSRRFLADGSLKLTGLELLKGLASVASHTHVETVPILDNSQQMSALALQLRAILQRSTNLHGFLLAGHGLYTWGSSLEEAFRHLEALEFLFEVTLRELAIATPNAERRS